MRNLLFAVLALLAACVTTPEAVPAGQVVRAGQDTYRISGSNESCGNCESPELRAAQQASAYCAKSGKVLDAARQSFDIGIGHHYTLTFACVDRR